MNKKYAVVKQDESEKYIWVSFFPLPLTQSCLMFDAIE